MSYLIVGGTGFIGAYLAKKLVDENKKVVIYDYMPNKEVISDIVEKVDLVQGDIQHLGQIIRTVKEYDVEYIINLAALLSRESNKNPSMAIEINCLGADNVFQAALLNGVKRVVWASSDAVFGSGYEDIHFPLNENSPVMPDTVYGACKLFDECLGSLYNTEYAVDNVGLRFTFVYGAGRIRGVSYITNDLFVKPLMGTPVTIPYAKTTLDWLYVKDAVKAILLAANAEKLEHKTFIISGEAKPVYEVAEYVKKLIPGAVFDLQPGDQGFLSSYDRSRARKELGYEPSYSVEKGVEECIRTLRQTL